MADLDLNELERLEKAATPGPWVLHQHSDTGVVGGSGYVVAACGGYSTNTRDPDDLHSELHGNAALLAAMRNALPELLRRLRAAEADAERYRWLMENATRMSEPLYTRGTKASPVCGHRVSLIVSFDGDYRSTPWATQETFTAAIDAARKP